MANRHVTGHINALFPWADGKKKPEQANMEWVGVEKQKSSFPGGMNTVPMIWNHLGRKFNMTAWSGSMCACVSEDGCEVAPAVCVGFTIDAQQP